ncbi:hypothetical protein [Bacteroides faecis]|uniref:hypothetical protein n=1 Tax=Bacteroides faecis TaxID=674529 RepID=UPI0022E4A706|nr:hypothetical protein [Bacteroides faecis]
MNRLKKEKYEAPVTKHVQVEVESGICAASVIPEKGHDVGKDRHVNINQQVDGGDWNFNTGAGLQDGDKPGWD